MNPLFLLGLALTSLGGLLAWSDRQAQNKTKVNGQNLPANIANPVPSGGDSPSTKDAPAPSDAPPPST